MDRNLNLESVRRKLLEFLEKRQKNGNISSIQRTWEAFELARAWQARLEEDNRVP